ncbi:hypothetical protein F4820DRAFT_294896 [Hypoxylon rubiginosum]|uniref:Uncharacterized protein n=1 Tax=Hypoxylon rubiginosum TaxID=110542 RepID=A0ACB9Z183_9PEZI|nr:hypothetical protein F4820DRAFT_294896 [Hypoxylon rubiginosum]
MIFDYLHSLVVLRCDGGLQSTMSNDWGACHHVLCDVSHTEWLFLHGPSAADSSSGIREIKIRRNERSTNFLHGTTAAAADDDADDKCEERENGICNNFNEVPFFSCWPNSDFSFAPEGQRPGTMLGTRPDIACRYGKSGHWPMARDRPRLPQPHLSFEYSGCHFKLTGQSFKIIVRGGVRDLTRGNCRVTLYHAKSPLFFYFMLYIPVREIQLGKCDFLFFSSLSSLSL